MASQNELLLVRHALLVGLAGAIPLPLVDDLAKRAVWRRLVTSLARAHKLQIWSEEVAILADEHTVEVVGGAVKGALLFPIKRLLRKTFVVLAGKRIIDDVTATYHRGWLTDRAFATERCAPVGPYESRAVRGAIDAVMGEVPVASSPVWEAVKLVTERSQDALQKSAAALRKRFAKMRGDDLAEDDVDRDDDGMASVVEHLMRQLTEVPEQHFEDLAGRLADKLPDKLPDLIEA